MGKNRTPGFAQNSIIKLTYTVRGKNKRPKFFLILFSYRADLGSNFFWTKTLAYKNAEKNLYWKLSRLISEDEQFPKNKIRPKKAFWAILENQL